MKKTIFGLIALLSFSALAENDVVLTIKEVLLKQTCNVVVTNRPIDFDKQSDLSRTGKVYLQSYGKDRDKVRRLEIGRSIPISNISPDNIELRMKDPSIYHLCVDYSEGNSDCDDISNLTIGDIEQYSKFNLKINCTKDDVVIF